MFTAGMLLLGATVYVITIHGQQERGPSTQAFRDALLQGYAKWDKEVNAIEQLMRMDKADRKYLIPHGPKALPYLIVLVQIVLVQFNVIPG